MTRWTFVLAGVVAATLLGGFEVRAQSASPTPRALSATLQFEMAATVEAVDKTARTVRVRREGEAPVTLAVPPEVRNFDQIEVGDRVRANYVDEVAFSVRKPGAPGVTGEANVVQVAPLGEKPGATFIRTRKLTATITALDAERRLITLRGPQGNSRTIHLDPSAELEAVTVGDEVEVRHIEATVLAVEKAAR